MLINEKNISIMEKIKEFLWQAFALSFIFNFLNDDCHHSGPTKRGWEIINEKYNKSK